MSRLLLQNQLRNKASMTHWACPFWMDYILPGDYNRCIYFNFQTPTRKLPFTFLKKRQYTTKEQPYTLNNPKLSVNKRATEGGHSFPVTATKPWNKLKTNLKQNNSIKRFQTGLFDHLLTIITNFNLLI